MDIISLIELGKLLNSGHILIAFLHESLIVPPLPILWPLFTKTYYKTN